MSALVSAPLPVKPDGLLFINRLKAGKSLRGFILCDEPFGVNVHYVDERSRLCLGRDSCLFCERGLTRRWKGYLSVIGFGLHARPEILEITQDLCSQILSLNPDKANMRGWEIEVKRGGSDNSRLLLLNLYKKSFHEKLPAMPDMVPSLTAFFLQ